MPALYTEQVFIDENGEQTIYRVINGIEKAPVSTNGFDYSALAAERSEGGKVLVRRYPVAQDEDMFDKILSDITLVGAPTHMYTTKDNGFTVIWIKDQIDGEFNLREWLDFRTFTITMSDKIEKRFGFLAQPTYLHESYNHVTVLWDDEPEPAGATLSVRIVTQMTDENLFDGNNIMRPSVVKKAARNIKKRLEAIGHDKAEQIAANHRTCKVFNGRLRLAEGLGKGDFVVAASDDAIDADFIVFAPNLKKEIKAADGVVRFLAFPQVQHDHVRLNRQSIAHFYEPLFAGIVEEAFTERVDDMINLFNKGDVPGWMKEEVEDEKIQNYKDRIAYFIERVGSLNNSPAMLNLARRQMWYMLEPKGIKDDERGRKMFIPNAKNVSIRSYASYLAAGYEPRSLHVGEAFYSEIGLILEDDTYLAAQPILGGCDLDDHITVIPRVSTSDHVRVVHHDSDEHATFVMEAQAGETVLVIYRDPIGVASNGEEVASEWMFVNIASGEKVDAAHSVDLAAMPKITGELSYPEPTFVPRTKPSQDDYTQVYALESLEAAAKYAGTYGSHSNRMTVLAMHRIAIPFRAFETVYADECQQIRDAENMAWIMADNEAVLDLIVDSGVALDPTEKKRLGLKKGRTEAGVFTNLAVFHRREVARFNQAATLWINNSVVAANLRRLAGYAVRTKPVLVLSIEKAETMYRDANGIGGRFLDWEQYGAIGDFVVSKLDEAGWDEEKWNTEILRAVYFLLSNRAAGSGSYDTALTNGALFFRLCDALVALKAQA